MEVLGGKLQAGGRAHAGKVLALQRIDAPEGGKGKPCGAAHIPKQHKCSKGTGTPINNNLEIAAKIAVGAGLLAGGVYLAKPIRNKQRPPSMEEWRKSPLSVRNNPKLSPEDAQRIADEAIAGGQIWDVQEKINARRRAERAAECGGGLGKTQAPAKFDALVPRPLCQAGEGAFGTYFVHQSEKYGVKLFRNGDEDDVGWEADRLDRARAAGVNVPQPLGINVVKDQDGDVRAQTLILSHMRGYQQLSDVYRDANGNATNAPAIIQVKIARQFRKLHVDGLAHGDIHSGNIMVHARSKRVALVDFGYSTQISDDYQPSNARTGVENLLYDLRRLPGFLGFVDKGSDFISRHKGVLDNIEIQANDYSRSWEKYELAVGRYHDALERELLWDERRPRSRFISGADQPRIPGLTRRILTANMNTRNRELIEPLPIDTYFQSVARNLGVKPARLFRALKPERDARRARNRAQPLGTPFRAAT